MGSIAKILLIAIAIIVLLIVILALIGWWRTVKTERDARQKIFAAGHVPNLLPDGFYKGEVISYKGTWTGKTFDSQAKTGINNFSDGNQLYHFAYYEGIGLRDPGLKVIKIDYNRPENPFWVRYIVDEIVETDTHNNYLGKIHLHLLGLTFTIGYFSLTK